MAICDVCGKDTKIRIISGIAFCSDCYEKLNYLRAGDPTLALHYAASRTNSCYTEKASEYMYLLAVQTEAVQKAAEAARAKSIAEEQQKQAFAKSRGEFYEYEVVTIPNDGQINKDALRSTLQSMAKSGWRLHTIYSNEIGKNSFAGLDKTINSTASEDVMIFERRVAKV